MKKYRPRKIGVPASARVGVVLPPLTDAYGDPFDHLPCADAPLSWDEDAAEPTKRASAATCLRACPALIACEARLYQIGQRATGVWAGHVLRESGVGDSDADAEGVLDGFPKHRDPLVVRWAAQAGIELPPVPE